MREPDLILQEATQKLRDFLPAQLALYEADSGITLPVPAAQNITYGFAPLDGRPPAIPSIWTRMTKIRPVRLSTKRIHPGKRTLQGTLESRLYLPMLKTTAETAERGTLIYCEAVFRTLERRMVGGRTFAIYLNEYDLDPPPMTEEAIKGVIREAVLRVDVHFQMDRHNLSA